MPTELSQRHLDLLRRYDTPTICNVIELFAVRPRNTGYMDGRIRCCFPELGPLVGYAATATHRAAFERSDASGYAALDEQVRRFEELPRPPVVVLQDLDDPPVAASFGEIMCATYRAFGAAGLITSGAARDLDQVRRLGFPVFASGVICSHGYSHLVSLHVPVRVGGLAVHPGDLLHGDVNGVTNIPLEVASEVAEVAAEYVAAEAIVLDFLKTGPGDVRLFAEARRASQEAIARLAARVRRKAD
ncbi:MAG: RraA family protein [Bryobacterales bacterium]|nr:RraA family protein [Bryobacterales bacterium]